MLHVTVKGFSQKGMEVGYRIEPNHGQRVPTGAEMEGGLLGLLRRQLDAVISAYQNNRQVDLTPFVDEMRRYFEPYLGSQLLNGAVTAIARVLSRIEGRKGGRGEVFSFFLSNGIRKRFESIDEVADAIGVDWGLLTRQAQAAAQSLSMSLAVSTLRTANREADRAIQNAREAIQLGLEHGEAVRDMSVRLRQIFSPDRALAIAQTESSRAFHAGQMMAAQESDVIGGLSWLASSDACDLCLSLARKDPVPLGQPFAVIGTGPYASIYHPPAHPHCYCSVTEVFVEDMPGYHQPRESPAPHSHPVVPGRTHDVTPIVVAEPVPRSVPVSPPVSHPLTPRQIQVDWVGRNDLPAFQDALSSMVGGRVDEARAVALTGGNAIPGISGLEGHVTDKKRGKFSIGYTGKVGNADVSILREFDLPKKVIHNELFVLGDDAKGKGHALAMFTEQVVQAISMGFRAIETYAAGSVTSRTFQGYAVWPRFGYDAPIHPHLLDYLPPGLQNAKKVSDLMATKAGREWWTEYGSSIDLKFDLLPGSKSRTFLASYLRVKGFAQMADYIGGLAHGVAPEKMAQASSQKGDPTQTQERVEASGNKSHGDEIDLSQVDIEISDEALDRLFRFGEPK